MGRIKRYKKYDERVQSYMQSLRRQLRQDYGKVDSSWKVSLDLIANNYAIYLKALDDILENGFDKVDANGRLSKNPSISIMNNAQAYLQKLLSNFGLTPMSKSKMKSIKDDADDDNKYLDFLVS